jgi:hypothetical protein
MLCADKALRRPRRREEQKPDVYHNLDVEVKEHLRYGTLDKSGTPC